MQKLACGLRVALFFLVVVLGTVNIFGEPLAYADSESSTSAAQPVTVIAVCEDATTATADWRVGNPNPYPVTVTWNDGSKTDTISAPYGFTDGTSTFDVTNPYLAVVFSQDGQPDQTVSVSNVACPVATDAAPCVDGLVRANLGYTWSQNGTVTVSTVNSAPLCDDVTVYLSSYVLPATYDGSGSFDDSSIPQQEFSSRSAVLHKGTSGDVTLQIVVPNACTDYQLDLYYAPEVTVVSYHGHGDQLIYGNVYLHTSSSCTPPVGGRGGGQILGESTTVPAPALANTGSDTLFPTASALTLVAAAAIVNFSIPARIKRAFVKK